jgi:hypothetical protein
LFHILNAVVSNACPHVVETVTDAQSDSGDKRIGQSIPLAFSAFTWFSKTNLAVVTVVVIVL